MKSLHCVSFALVIIGALNWGLVAIANLVGGDLNLNVVNVLLGSWPIVENVVYLLVGLAAICLLVCCGRDCKTCESGSCEMK